MTPYIHSVNYYETDKMGITHHSNYIRFMEEARLHFLAEAGYPMQRLEAEGITSPVVSLNCDYKHPTTYGDKITITVTAQRYTGVKLSLSYVMQDEAGLVVATATSSHCFLDQEGRVLAVRKHAPTFDAILKRAVEGHS